MTAKLSDLAVAAEQGVQVLNVDFSNEHLNELPISLLLPFKDTLEFINLGGNNLTDLPFELSEFKRIKILFFANNKFQQIPSIIKHLPELRMVSFKSNELESIEENIFPLSLEWLILTDNKLKGKVIVLHSSRLIFIFVTIHRTSTKYWSLIKTTKMFTCWESITFITRINARMSKVRIITIIL
jgi:hypothetical protein